MSRSVKMIIWVMVSLIFLSAVSFVLLSRFYFPLNRHLFGGEFPISIDDIQFWVNKAPKRSYYRVYAKYKKYPKDLMSWADFSQPVFYADDKGILGFDAIFFNLEDNKIYGGGLKKTSKNGGGLFIISERGKSRMEYLNLFFQLEPGLPFVS